MSDVGWFKVSRKLFSHPIADDKPWDRLSAWLYLISLAAHDDYIAVLRQHEYPLKRGRLALSVADFGAKTGWSREKVRVFLAWLRKHGMIKLYSDHASTFVLIVNYDKWQGTEDNQADNQESNQANNQADASIEEGLERVDNQANNQPHNQAENQAREESTPLVSPLKKEGRRSSTKGSLPTLSKSKPTYSAVMNYETGKFEITAEALAKLDQDHPTVDLAAEIKNAEGWCLDTAKKHKIVNGMSFLGKWMTKPTCKQRDVELRFNSGALKGQVYKVVHGASQVQANKRPEPVMDMSKILRKD